VGGGRGERREGGPRKCLPACDRLRIGGQSPKRIGKRKTFGSGGCQHLGFLFFAGVGDLAVLSDWGRGW